MSKKITKKEIEKMERFQQEMADLDWQMGKAEDAMWREGVLSLIKNGVKPLMVF